MGELTRFRTPIKGFSLNESSLDSITAPIFHEDLFIYSAL